MSDTIDLTTLADQALDAFWDAVVRSFPEARTGDLSPWATVRLELAARDAVREWVAYNVPSAALGRGGDRA